MLIKIEGRTCKHEISTIEGKVSDRYTNFRYNQRTWVYVVFRVYTDWLYFLELQIVLRANREIDEDEEIRLVEEHRLQRRYIEFLDTCIYELCTIK